MNVEQKILLLFSRLTWPSGLVKERACNAIAELSLSPMYKDLVFDKLKKWIASQSLESIVCIGLLSLIRLQILDKTIEVPRSNILSDLIQNRSLLSWLLLNEINPDDPLILENFLECSENAPIGYEPNQFFQKYIEVFIPPIFNSRAQDLEKDKNISFHKQWAYEWDYLLQKINKLPSAKLINHWFIKDYLGEHYISAETEMSHIYFSSYLRTLAWACKIGVLDKEVAIYLAAEICPIDIELWKLAPLVRPKWWPKATEPKGMTDTAIGQIWDQVENLWRNQNANTTNLLNKEWILTQASGTVFHGKIIYDLELCGIFQKCFGPKIPAPEKIIQWYRGMDNSTQKNRLRIIFNSRLSFKGIIKSHEAEALERRFDDWAIIPSASYSIITTRWQPWRLQRSIWLPSSALGNPPISFSFKEDCIRIDDSNQMISKWNDWTDGIAETQYDYIPRGSGQYLLIKRSILEDFYKLTDFVFCWVCRLNVFYREQDFVPYKQFSDFRYFGESRVVKL